MRNIYPGATRGYQPYPHPTAINRYPQVNYAFGIYSNECKATKKMISSSNSHIFYFTSLLSNIPSASKIRQIFDKQHIKRFISWLSVEPGKPICLSICILFDEEVVGSPTARVATPSVAWRRNCGLR